MSLSFVDALSSADDKWTGIEESTGLLGFRKKLSGSDMEPKDLLDRVEQSLDFMGHGASKWSHEPDKMREMLLRISNLGKACRVRMLVLDPFDAQCQEAAARQTPGDPLHHKRKIIASLLRMEQLCTHDNFELRLYDHPPKLRITIIDHALAIVGHYRNYLIDSDRADSAESPLLAFSGRPSWSFISPFQLLFDHEWDKGIEVSWDDIHQWHKGDET
jgi:hypothetical protein